MRPYRAEKYKIRHLLHNFLLEAFIGTFLLRNIGSEYSILMSRYTYLEIYVPIYLYACVVIH